METVRAMQTIKLFQRENDRQNLWQNRYAEAMNADIRVEKLRIGYGVINGLLFGLENIVVVYLAARAVMGDVFSVGMLFAFMSYKQRFVDSMDGLIEQLIEIRMIGLHLDRLADITFTPAENVDAALPALPGEQRAGISGALTVRRLSYQYSDADPPVLAGIDLDIEPGEAVAIVGPSGCGKTTLLKCLMGLLSPSAGEIRVDGQPMHQVSGYRAAIAAVMQDEQLLSGSIADNIACFDPQPDLKRVQEAAQLAAIHEDILEMPMQYNTLVGDMGTSLSGGQKQRVVLARALYRQPRILFMDEATSHLDAANEHQVNENIRQLNMTRIIVAHRQETIESANRVIDLGIQHHTNPL